MDWITEWILMYPHAFFGGLAAFGLTFGLGVVDAVRRR